MSKRFVHRTNYDYAQHVGQLCRNSGDKLLYFIVECYSDNIGNLRYMFCSTENTKLISAPVVNFHNGVEFLTRNGIKRIE